MASGASHSQASVVREGFIRAHQSRGVEALKGAGCSLAERGALGDAHVGGARHDVRRRSIVDVSHDHIEGLGAVGEIKVISVLRLRIFAGTTGVLRWMEKGKERGG